MSLLIVLLIVLAVLALCGGGYLRGSYGYAAWSPLAAIIVILIVLYLTGYLR